ncbi:MAG: hypothetical protein ACYSR9_06240 [Planctomycetota bacterium]|jgi:hypothetical protein
MKSFNRLSKKPISKNIMAILMLYSAVFVFVEPANSANQFELFYSGTGISGESSSENFSQSGSVLQTDGTQASSEQYSVAEDPIVFPYCFIDFEHFAQFAMYWLEVDCGADDNYCYGADLDWSTDVGLSDVGELAYWWLSECPPDWPWQ